MSMARSLSPTMTGKCSCWHSVVALIVVMILTLVSRSGIAKLIWAGARWRVGRG
jgi:hypothetical protein